MPSAPVVSALTMLLSAGVSLMIEHGLLPLVSVFIEPAKVLFLNNAINHGIFSPIGIEQARQTGQSIMFLLETNPGPGLGVLLAYWAFARGAARSSAPGAIVIQFFGGIHEIYFPYVLMRPVIILAPIAGSAAAILFYSLTGTGLTAVASPGSIIAVLAMAPKGEMLWVLAGVVIAAAVSFFVAAPIVKRAQLEEVNPIRKPNGKVIGGANRPSRPSGGPIPLGGLRLRCRHGVECDGGHTFPQAHRTAGQRRARHQQLGRHDPRGDGHRGVQSQLSQRAELAAPASEVVVIGNFLTDPALDGLYERIECQRAAEEQGSEHAAEASAAPESAESSSQMLTLQGIRTGLAPVGKEEAIRAAGALLAAGGYVDEGYAQAMVDRERVATTYLGMGIAIPHGTAEAKSRIRRSGIVVMQYPEGVDFGGERAQLVIGIARRGRRAYRGFWRV